MCASRRQRNAQHNQYAAANGLERKRLIQENARENRNQQKSQSHERVSQMQRRLSQNPDLEQSNGAIEGKGSEAAPAPAAPAAGGPVDDLSFGATDTLTVLLAHASRIRPEQTSRFAKMKVFLLLFH